MSTRNSTPRLGVLLLIALTGIARPALAQLDVQEDRQKARVLSLLKQVADGYAIVVVAVGRPDDMGTMTIEQPRYRWRRAAWPRLAQLRAQPVTAFPCYLEYQFDQVPATDRLQFVGRCRETSSLELVFRYPLRGEGWREIPLTLDLSSASSPPAEDTGQQLERWARAQAQWFRLLAECTRDVGGFFTFAERQTVRKFDVLAYDEYVPPRERIRRPEQELYNITTGALAVQESLQLDRMTETDRDRGRRTIPISEIPAVSVRSHPFDAMRRDAEPRHGDLAGLVPEDQYYVRFANVGKLLELLDFAEQWGTSLLRLASPVGTDHGTRARTLGQLCLTDDLLARALGPAVIAEVAITGSDPYLRAGSDISILFRVKNRAVFRLAVDAHLEMVKRAHADAAYQKLTHADVALESLVGPQRRVSCYRCWLDDVCVYSNSLMGLQRVIDTHAGRHAGLASAPGFRYMRAMVFPLDEQLEDGFLYLSDPFIRRLVGPELRIKQKRRLEALTSLKLLTNAAMFYGFQHSPSRPTYEDLVADQSLSADDLYDPEGGEFVWDAELGVARSTTYGDLGFLTPLVEIDASKATEKEKEQYDQFRERYQQYWRTYFDPIGVRLKVDRTIQLETCILPLIDSTAYDDFEDTTGGEPVEVDLRRFTPATLLRFVMHLDDGALKAEALTFLNMMTGTNAASDWVGQWLTFWIEDTDAFTKLVRRSHEPAEDDTDTSVDQKEALDVFNASFVLGVHVRNKVSLAAFLVALRSMIQTTAPNTVVFNNLLPHRGVTIVQIAPDPAGELARELGLDTASQPATTQAAPMTQPVVSEQGPAIYYATIKDGFYISTQASALRSLIDRFASDESPTGAADKTVRANVLLYAAPRAAELVGPTVRYLMEQRARHVSVSNLGQVWLLGRCGLLDDRSLDQVAKAYLGYRLVCPNRGTYRYDAETDEAFSSVYGSLRDPQRLPEPPQDSPLATLLDTIETIITHLRFTEEGLATTVAIERR